LTRGRGTTRDVSFISYFSRVAGSVVAFILPRHDTAKLMVACWVFTLTRDIQYHLRAAVNGRAARFETRGKRCTGRRNSKGPSDCGSFSVLDGWMEACNRACTVLLAISLDRGNIEQIEIQHVYVHIYLDCIEKLAMCVGSSAVHVCPFQHVFNFSPPPASSHDLKLGGVAARGSPPAVSVASLAYACGTPTGGAWLSATHH